MNVLRGTHTSLVPGGTVADLHPVPPAGRIESGGRVAGRLDERRFFDIVRATERGMEAAVDAGLFVLEEEFARDVIERFDTPEELFETAADWENIALPLRVRQQIEDAPGPVDLVERIVFRRYRAL